MHYFPRKNKKWLALTVLTILLSSCQGLTTSVNTSDTNSISKPVIKENTMLHFTFPLNDSENYPNPYIGDVHPYYDQKTEMWYMYYLDTTGQFNSKLLTSKDGITWTENTDFWIHSSLANYGVLNIFEKDGTYYSYYHDFHTSKSTDLINWYYAGGEYQIPQDKAQFPGGMRDPSVTYDETTNAYYAIGLNYTRRVPAEGIYQSNLAITKSIGDNQLAWEPNHLKVFTNDPMSKDFECPQLVKIGRRWYVVASQYGNSVHGVGKTSYLIGDVDKNPYEVDWQSKPLNSLTTEDLCAAQIAKKDDKFYIFGWIPRDYNAGFWGGFINLPTEVYALADGSLATRLEPIVGAKLTGENVDSMTTKTTLNSGQELELDIYLRFDNEYKFEINAGAILELRQKENSYRIIITNTINKPTVQVFAGTYQCFNYELRPGALNGINNLRVIGEGKNLELELNDTYVLTSRIARSLTLDGEIDTNIIRSLQGQINIISVSSNKLNFLAEIQ